MEALRVPRERRRERGGREEGEREEGEREGGREEGGREGRRERERREGGGSWFSLLSLGWMTNG